MPSVFAGMAVLMGGLCWVIKRRQQNMAAGLEAAEDPPGPGEDVTDEPDDDPGAGSGAQIRE
jgi:hypothetical protein